MVDQGLIGELSLKNPLAYKGLFVLTGTVLTFLFGEWDTILQALVAIVILDYITGVMSALYEKKLDSRVGYKGIIKKFCIFFIIAVAGILDTISGLPEPVLHIAISVFFIGNEGLSILENCAKMGVPMPALLLDALQQLKKK